MTQAPRAVSARDKLIVALDTDEMDFALQLIDELRQFVGLFKIGLELFSAAGPALLAKLKSENVPVFFDGKFHDIPNTTARASQVIASYGVRMLNVHASGGSQMLCAAIEAVEKICQKNALPPASLLAVTVLTSLDEEAVKSELAVASPLAEHVCHLALLAKNCRLNGVVASAREIAAIRQACGTDFLIVTPGVRPSWSCPDDQARTATPGQALAAGADFLVVGRPITGAKNRVDAARRVLAEMEEAMA